MNINFFMPTRVIMTENCISKNATLFQEYDHNALIVTGANSAKSSGGLQDTIEAFTPVGIE